ncbi:hypothetical protein [Vibrio maerlii]|uniref:hypothetical protein n=1 Tax=Vibrio maerlii TaxID=2231648 RepID=UPI000E3B7A93|nr:hypothetical protein [Vibrio maerlii]
MENNKALLRAELKRLKKRIEAAPLETYHKAEQCLIRAEQYRSTRSIVLALVIMSRCQWSLMDYGQGLKYAKKALIAQNELSSDTLLPEILHIHALNFYGQANYYSAQQYWIQSLEQATLVENATIQTECLIGLGNVWRMVSDYKNAIDAHNVALTVANATQIHWLEGKASILLAWDYYQENNYIGMLTVLDNATEALKFHNDPTWEAEIWDFRGLALLGLERLDDADTATLKAQQLAEKHDLAWMKAHSYISRARLEILRKNHETASEYLKHAVQAASRFDNGELLSQICFQQSAVAEAMGNDKEAYLAFKNYRKYSIGMLHEQSQRLSMDKANESKRQLDLKAKKLVSRIRAQYDYDPEKKFTNVIPETQWWEQLIVYKTELRASNYAVFSLYHSNPDYLDKAIELAHCLCNQDDSISRLNENRVGFLIHNQDNDAQLLSQTLQSMLALYPWQRKGLEPSPPKLRVYGILQFPFTIEQLEEEEEI